MSGEFAPGARCAPCNLAGHFCQAYDYDDNNLPVCVSCLDGALCEPARRSGRSVPPPAAATAATATRRYFGKAQGSRAVAICSRGCGKPSHRGQCAGNARLVAKATPAPVEAAAPIEVSVPIETKCLSEGPVIAMKCEMPIPAKKEDVPMPKGSAASPLHMRVVRQSDMPASNRLSGANSVILKMLRELQPDEAVEVAFEGEVHSRLFQKRVGKLLRASGIAAVTQRYGARVYISKRLHRVSEAREDSSAQPQA